MPIAAGVSPAMSMMRTLHECLLESANANAALTTVVPLPPLTDQHTIMIAPIALATVLSLVTAMCTPSGASGRTTR
jgi:hypothetical protein